MARKKKPTVPLLVSRWGVDLLWDTAVTRNVNRFKSFLLSFNCLHHHDEGNSCLKIPSAAARALFVEGLSRFLKASNTFRFH